MKQGFCIVICLLVMSACAKKPYYLSQNFKQKTKTHQLIAVLPVQMVFTGTPMGLVEEEDIVALEDAESKAFQMSLFNELLKSTTMNKGIKVDFQSVEKTNQILKEQDISIRDSWELSPEALADKLGVDAVIRSRVTKQRYMTDLASYGIDLGRKVLGMLTKFKSSVFLSGSDLEKTNDIKATCSLLNATDSSVLWSMDMTDETDWSKPTTEVIDNINAQFARHFPYRK